MLAGFFYANQCQHSKTKQIAAKHLKKPKKHIRINNEIIIRVMQI